MKKYTNFHHGLSGGMNYDIFFRAFKGYEDPRSNQAEVIDAGWFYKRYI